jgi:toxin secretion/phage lysis holin
MENNLTFSKMFTAAVGSLFTAIFGGYDLFFQVLSILIVLDIFTGYIKAISLGQLSSKKAFFGGLKKLLIYFVIIVFAQMDRVVSSGAATTFGFANMPPVFRASACIYYICGEGISILENMALLGLQVPQALLAKLKIVHSYVDRQGNKQIDLTPVIDKDQKAL